MLVPDVCSKKVKIVNPVENGAAVTSRKRALQFVQSGRAVFVGQNQLRFIETDPRNRAAAERATRGYAAVDRKMTETELRNIPLVRPARALREMMTDRARAKGGRPPAGRTGPGRVLTLDGVPQERLR